MTITDVLCLECDSPLRFVYCWDDAQETNHCFNIYVCDECGALHRRSVWENPHVLVVRADGAVTRFPEKSAETHSQWWVTCAHCGRLVETVPGPEDEEPLGCDLCVCPETGEPRG